MVIVVASILAFAMLVAGTFVSCRLYRRRKEKQNDQIIKQELDFDFDNSDVDIEAMRLIHARSSSNGSLPLLTRNEGVRPSSAVSIHSGTYPSPTQNYTALTSPTGPRPLPSPYDRPKSTLPSTSKPTTPILKESSSQLQNIASSSLAFSKEKATNPSPRTSFVFQPHPVFRPEMRRTKSREALDLRSGLLTRLASTRSSKRPRSVDAAEEPESPKSVYSQLSAAHEDFRPSTFRAAVEYASPVPPLPALPEHYQKYNLGASGWRMDTGSDALTTPAATLGSGTPKRPLSLDSRILPLPLPDKSEAVNEAANTHWFSGLLAAEPDAVSVRSVEVTHGMPHYSRPPSPQEGKQGAIGYQLSPKWRA